MHLFHNSQSIICHIDNIIATFLWSGTENRKKDTPCQFKYFIETHKLWWLGSTLSKPIRFGGWGLLTSSLSMIFYAIVLWEKIMFKKYIAHTNMEDLVALGAPLHLVHILFEVVFVRQFHGYGATWSGWLGMVAKFL